MPTDSKAMHTPGPWRWDERAGVVFSADGRNIVSMGSAAFEANARLIAAAPDLLAALKRLEYYMTETCSHSDDGVLSRREDLTGEWKLIDAARAAIASATGGR